MMEPTKKDWKLFRDKISAWQEAYIEKIDKEYILLLSGDLPASTKFWELGKRLKIDKKRPGVCIELNKSNMIFDIVSLINDGVISLENLDEFSDELKESVKFLLERL
ncbi:MAG: multidrug transporter [Velocimicrobium sp.]